MTKTDAQALLPVTQEMLTRMSNQISEWEMDEPRSDCGQYQRDFADANTILTDVQSDQIIAGIASSIANGRTESQSLPLPGDGRVLVPFNTTPAMRQAGADNLFGAFNDDWGDDADAIWKAMIAAALSSAVSGDAEEGETGTAVFERESRYIVIKKSHLTAARLSKLKSYMHLANVGTVAAVVVEADWPEYETVWQMIEKRVAGDAK